MSRKIIFVITCILLNLICLMPKGFSDDWQRVYLASFPRSGNHWVRYLIEEATHIATSSVYHDKDPIHLNHLFPWGGFCANQGYEGNCRYPEENEIVVMKTHFPNSLVVKVYHHPYVRTIRLVRHPIDCFYSLYVYHVSRKKRPGYYIPKSKLLSYIKEWARFENFWDNQKNVSTFRYEDLYHNPHEVLRQILDAIGYQVTEEDIDRAVKKHPPKGEPLKHLPHYKTDDLQAINERLQGHLEKHSYEIPNL